MSHLVKPVSFRAGKTQPWANNTFLRNNKSLINSDLLLANGIAKLNKALLRRKRLYLVKGSVIGSCFSRVSYNLIYAPKIKTKPREHLTGAFLRRSIYKPFNWETEAAYAESYVDRRKEKTARIRKRYKPKQLNKWLTRRMFRGAGRISRISRATIKTTRMSRRIVRTRKARIIHLRATNDSSRTFKHAMLLRCMPEGRLNTATFRNNRPHLLPASTALVPSKGFLIRKAKTTRRDKWKLKRSKWKFDRIKNRQFNSRRLSVIVSRKLDRKIRIRVLNLFSYLVSKQVISFKTHQNHFWNFTYRRYRFHYKNYYDIVNAFLAMGVLDHAEGFLLSILRRVLPLILKIKRFFKFLNAVIKNMPELQDKFYVFKIHIAGKLAGGTKRTKAHSIGYGVLPVQTIDVAASNNFLAYRHIYGAFGLRLLMCKNPTYKSLTMLR